MLPAIYRPSETKSFFNAVQGLELHQQRIVGLSTLTMVLSGSIGALLPMVALPVAHAYAWSPLALGLVLGAPFFGHAIAVALMRWYLDVSPQSLSASSMMSTLPTSASKATKGVTSRALYSSELSAAVLCSTLCLLATLPLAQSVQPNAFSALLAVRCLGGLADGCMTPFTHHLLASCSGLPPALSDRTRVFSDGGRPLGRVIVFALAPFLRVSSLGYTIASLGFLCFISLTCMPRGSTTTLAPSLPANQHFTGDDQDDKADISGSSLELHDRTKSSGGNSFNCGGHNETIKSAIGEDDTLWSLWSSFVALGWVEEGLLGVWYPFFLATTAGGVLSTGSLLLALLLPSWGASVGSVLTATAADPNASAHSKSRKRQLERRQKREFVRLDSGHVNHRGGYLQAKVSDAIKDNLSEGSSRSDDDERSNGADSTDSTRSDNSDTESWNMVGKLRSSEKASSPESQRASSGSYQSRHRGIRYSSSDESDDYIDNENEDNDNYPKKGARRRWSRYPPPPPCSPLVSTHSLPAIVCALLALFLNLSSIDSSQEIERRRGGRRGPAVVALTMAVTVLRGLHASTASGHPERCLSFHRTTNTQGRPAHSTSITLAALSALLAAVVTGALLGTNAALLHHLQSSTDFAFASTSRLDLATTNAMAATVVGLEAPHEINALPFLNWAPVFASAAAVHGVAAFMARER